MSSELRETARKMDNAPRVGKDLALTILSPYENYLR
jgi:hypothetical protein